MPRIHFVNDDVEVEVSIGTTLSLASHQTGAGPPFGCRAGTCGTCVVTVVEGEDGIESPGFVEADTLEVCGEAEPGRRLACQIIVRDADLAVEW